MSGQNNTTIITYSLFAIQANKFYEYYLQMVSLIYLSTVQKFLPILPYINTENEPKIVCASATYLAQNVYAHRYKQKTVASVLLLHLTIAIAQAHTTYIVVNFSRLGAHTAYMKERTLREFLKVQASQHEKRNGIFDSSKNVY